MKTIRSIQKLPVILVAAFGLLLAVMPASAGNRNWNGYNHHNGYYQPYHNNGWNNNYNNGYYRNGYYSHHRGHWQNQNGLRVFISL